MQRRAFLIGVPIVLLVPGLAQACDKTKPGCGPVPENKFAPGSNGQPPDCVLDFRLPEELLTRKGIIRKDGTYEWTLRLITFDRNGRPRWQQAHRVDNQPSKRQGVYHGTTVATYITCDKFTGWYSTGPIKSCGKPTFKRVDWPFDWKGLEAAVNKTELTS